MNKKKVLSFIDWYLPGYQAGGTIRAFSNMTDYMQNFEFYIVTRDVDYQSVKPYENIQYNAWNQLTENVFVKYLSQDQLNKNTLRQQFREKDFSAVYIHGIYSYFFSILPVFLARKLKNIPVVVAAHGMLGSHAVGVKTKKKQLFLTAAKILGLYKKVIFHAANADEAADVIKNIGTNARVKVAQEFPRKIPFSLDGVVAKKSGELRLISVARVAPEKNQLYAAEVLQKIENRHIIFDIYGPIYSDAYWKDIEQVIENTPEGIEINYKGSVNSDEVIATMKNYHALFLPTTGENFGHTILESMMAGTPVIISANTPWKGLESEKVGWDIPLDNKDAFVHVVRELAQYDNTQLTEMRQNALKYAEKIAFDEAVILENENLFVHE